jgi:lipopolysaccharide assembly outer membrane protein LptD (OstA)
MEWFWLSMGSWCSVRLRHANAGIVACRVAFAGLTWGEIKTPQNVPMEITSTGQTTYENGLATARDNVAIHIGNTDIYADWAQYNSATHDVDLRGHVRIYRDTSLYVADSGVYNTETKKIRAISSRTESQPYFLRGADVNSIEDNGYLVHGGYFTTADSAKPDFHLHAQKIRIYEGDRVIFQYVTAYIGNVPVFWWPYLYQSLSDTFSFSVSPAYTSTWGPSILGQVNFPITEHIRTRLRLDILAAVGRPLVWSLLSTMARTTAVRRG